MAARACWRLAGGGGAGASAKVARCAHRRSAPHGRRRRTGHTHSHVRGDHQRPADLEDLAIQALIALLEEDAAAAAHGGVAGVCVCVGCARACVVARPRRGQREGGLARFRDPDGAARRGPARGWLTLRSRAWRARGSGGGECVTEAAKIFFRVRERGTRGAGQHARWPRQRRRWRAARRAASLHPRGSLPNPGARVGRRTRPALSLPRPEPASRPEPAPRAPALPAPRYPR